MWNVYFCPGNTTPAAEFNFHFDPESVFITLQSFTSKCEVFLITYEYTLDYPLTFEQVDDWLNADKNDKTLFTKVRQYDMLTKTNLMSCEICIMVDLAFFRTLQRGSYLRFR